MLATGRLGSKSSGPFEAAKLELRGRNPLRRFWRNCGRIAHSDDLWDTSALLKLYVAEPDSPQFDWLAYENDTIVSSTIVTTEMLCALYRKEQAGDLKRGGAAATFRRFRQDIDDGRITAIPYGPDVLVEVEKLMKRLLYRSRQVLVRSLDAIHVASALAGKTRVIVATDARLRRVASMAHLKVSP